MSQTTPPLVSVVIPTYNRKDLLRQAITSSLAQSIVPEIIVLDDGSSDGTQQMMQTEFPRIRYERFNGPNGPCFLRTRGSEMARGEILFPIDDDSVFQSTHTIEQTLADFDHPRVAAVGIPFINVRKSPEVRQLAPDRTQRFAIAAFVGASHALRRDIFLQVNGYRPELFYMGEERDLCVRMLDLGYITRSGNADPIHHLESPQRVHRRADMYGRRNDILFVWQNVPLSQLPLRFLRASVAGLLFGLKVRRPLRMAQGLAWGYASILTNLSTRTPLNKKTLALYLRMKRHGPVLLSEIENQLVPIPDRSPAPIG